MKPRVGTLTMGFFPVAAIEEVNFELGGIDAVEAADIHVNFVRVRPRYVERCYATDRTEVMPGGPGVERINGEVALRRQQAEAVALDDPMQVSLLRAYRAIALARGRKFALDLEGNFAAVASAPVNHSGSSLSQLFDA